MVRGAFEELLVPAETPEMEIMRLRREKKEWEIAAYICFGLFLLIWLARR